MTHKIGVILGGSEGKMGQIIKNLAAKSSDIEIVYGFDPTLKDLRNLSDVVELGKELDKIADVYMDFTVPEAVIHNVEDASSMGLDSVIGTTGWYDRVENVKGIANNYKCRILYSPNFSPGVNVLFYATREVARLLGKLGYDATVREVHHVEKADAPSGTAIELGNILLKEMNRDGLAYERRGKRGTSEIDVLGARVGRVTGSHEIWFTPSESYSERLILQHDLFSREILGLGALIGVRWVAQAKKNRKQPGLYTFYEDVLGLAKD